MKKNPPVAKTDVLTIILHWMMVIALAFSLMTGLRVSADHPDSSWAQAISLVLLQGNVIQWHVWAAFVLFFSMVAYVIYLTRARLRNRIALDGTRLRNLRSQDHDTRWKSINVLIYWLAFVLLLVAATSGILLYFFPGLVAHMTLTNIHQFVAWSIIAYVIIHVLSQTFSGGVRSLLKIFNPQASYGAAAKIAILSSALIGAGIYALDRLRIDTLVAPYTKTAPVMDGEIDEIWKTMPSVDVPTNRGINSPGGEVTVSVRMTHDDDNLYALFEWPDSTRSAKHLPLKKTEAGWVVVQNEYYKQDEDIHYEDKFAVMLGRDPKIAGGGTSHYGSKPLKGKPGPLGGRGLHYTTDGSIVDVWHWKSVRTGSALMNQIDDNYFGPPLEVNPKKKRYTGGYAQDPSTGGGYKMNWVKFSTDTVTPLRLPKDPSMIASMQTTNFDPTVSDDQALLLDMADTVEYSQALDTYPIGTIMPSVLIKGERQGDRGDVTAASQWDDGWWRLEVSRKLDTQSKYDLAINYDDPTYMWLAVFDHTQTRHSQHLHPIKISLVK